MSKLETVVRVGIADLNFVGAPNRIRTSGLGSCVGVIVYDERKQVAGMAHVMLPESLQAKQDGFNPYKYADTAMELLIEGLLERGAAKFRLKAKMAGGAQMFQQFNGPGVMRIGPRNIEAVQEFLEAWQIPIVASDVGGNSGRTIEFDPINGDLYVRTVNENEQII